jgi:serine/threonine protein kinase
MAGLSKIMEDSSRSTSMAAMNPRWLAPEVLNGESATPAADVFAFGVVLWELMSWDLPWGTANPWGIVGAINQGGRPEIPAPEAMPGADSGSWAGLPRYTALMRRCWAQNPLDRPSFQEVVSELREIEPSIQA